LALISREDARCAFGLCLAWGVPIEKNLYYQGIEICFRKLLAAFRAQYDRVRAAGIASEGIETLLDKSSAFTDIAAFRGPSRGAKATDILRIKTMAKAKNDIKLVSSANTGFFYVTKKNPKNNTKKLELKKYDPVMRKHVVFKEGKIKESKK
jgi:large subunit ribosomal protein L33